MPARIQPDSVRRTKIVCTVGPATSSVEQLRALIGAGMNVARLNFSHGSQEEHGQVIERIRRLTDEMGVAVAILQDLAGPKVRVGTFADGAVELEPDAPFTLTTRQIEGCAQEASVSYPELPREVQPGDRLLLADGSILLSVKEVVDDDIRCTVVVGGTLSAHKGVNVPSGLFGLPIFRDKDLADLAFGVAQGVDYIGVSFVRTADDVRTAKREVEKHGDEIPIIAKIETQAALTHVDEILDEADGIMIARGDLSIETPFARVPMVQKELIAKASRRAKPAITATQMLFSMVESPSPTRAEVTDVANAVMDGSSAVMLSDETAVGKYPVRAVETMASIVAATEEGGRRLAYPRVGEDLDIPFRSRVEAFALGACELAERVAAEVIATLTMHGTTARFVAKYRPTQAILAATPRLQTFRRLALIRGVIPILLPATAQSTDDMHEAATAIAHSYGWKGKQLVVVSDDSIRSGEI
jgi:pyruvate kinase